ncbi:MAG: L,D-transpeptidase family protein [Phycisphaerae bacterium]
MTRQSQWWLIAGVGFVAVVAWGIYVWKYTRTPASIEVIATDSSAVAGPEPQGDGDDSAGSLTSLRATHQAVRPHAIEQPSDRASEMDLSAAEETLSSTVRANAPISLDDEAGFTIAHREPVATVDDAGRDVGMVEATVDVRGELDAARNARARGDLIGARASYAHALNLGLPDSEGIAVRSELANLAEALIFSRAMNPDDPLSFSHHVGGGESLNVIARRNKVTEALLASINHISNPNRLRAGARLKLIRGPFNAVIWKSAHRLDAYLGDIYVRSFQVGLGTNGGTPEGHWVVKNKLMNPSWTDPKSGRYYAAEEPDNPIGERWIGIECVEGGCLGRAGFGIHGTIEPKSIGENMSMGCVRLVPEDVALVYDLLVERHSHIDIRP